jgi:hypothetical protein
MKITISQASQRARGTKEDCVHPMVRLAPGHMLDSEDWWRAESKEFF